MEVHNNILTIRHRGTCSGEDGRKLADLMVQAGEALCKQCGTVVVYHDSSHLVQADEAYARAFATAFNRMECEHAMGALIPKALMRVLANFATTVSGHNMKVFKKAADGEIWLSAHRDTSCGPNSPVSVAEFLQSA